MLFVKGIFKKGAAFPEEKVEGRENQPVIITFLEGKEINQEDDWDELIKLIEDCVINTGIEDLAHQHNHYLYGTPKKMNEHESEIDPIKALRGSTRGKNLTDKLLKSRREDLELEEAKRKRR